MIKSIDLAWIAVESIKKSLHFFTETLGMKISSGDEKYKWVELVGNNGGMLLGIAETLPESIVKPGQNAVITITVESLNQAYDMLMKNGVNFIGDIMEIPGHVKMIWFKDIDGNAFQLVEKLD